MAEDQTKLEGLKEAWKMCKARDHEKKTLIEDLFRHIDDLSGELLYAKSELQDKKDVIKMARDNVEKADTRIIALEREKARQTFASVLIDGDDMLFKDELVSQGQEGGKRTACLLQQAVEEELRSLGSPAADNLQVIVRVYANKQGLARTYSESGILSEPALFDDFVRGFNMGVVMGDYVDAGNGKECADEKIKANFQIHLANVHCHRIFFGGASDNGYARLLGPYKYLEDESVRGRIVLLEGPPFARELASVKDEFHTVSFDHIFRSQKLNLNRKVSLHFTPPATPSANYATAAAKVSPSPPVPASAANQGSASVVPVTDSRKLLRNKYGHRVDAPLSYSPQDFVTLKARKLCNQFHLLGRCPYLQDRGQCQYNHREKLNPKQKMALIAVARQSACPSGLRCSDVDCLAGHRCTRDNCIPGTCRFPPAMHKVDTTIVG